MDFIQFFSWKGRINRLPFFIIQLLAGFISGIFEISLDYTNNLIYVILGLLIMIISSYIITVTTIKRFHDLDESGWHYFLLLIPFYNIYINIKLLFFEGSSGSNSYGLNPLRAGYYRNCCPACLSPKPKDIKPGKYRCNQCKSIIHIDEGKRCISQKNDIATSNGL